MNVVERLDTSVGQTRSILANTPTSEYEAVTPCSEWDVRALINHTIGALVMFADVLEHGEADMAVLMGDLIGDDALASYDAAATRSVSAWQKDGALDGVLTLPFAELPGAFGIQLLADDVLVHGWDLARATDQRVDWNQSLAAETLEFIETMFPPEARGDSFAPAIPVAEDADSMTRLVAVLGRRP